MLLECPGGVVLREEIRNQLWPNDTVVEFDHSINTAVMRLRDALGEKAGQPRYIETLARRGYRFVGQVEGPASVPPLVIVPRRDNGSFLSRVRRPWVPLAGLMLTMILLAHGVAWYYRRTSPTRWAREVALPEITRLVDAEDHTAAFPLLF